MDKSPNRKKTVSQKSEILPKKTEISQKKPASRKKKTAVPAAETLKEALLEVRGLEASILEDVVLDVDTTAPTAETRDAEPAWEPVAESTPTAPEIAADTAPAVTEAASETDQTETEAPAAEESAASAADNKPPKKHRKVRYAAPLGFAVLFLAAVGLISLCVAGVRLVKSWTDDSELRAELAEFLHPVTQTCPEEFTDAGAANDQDTLISSAIYSIAQPEYVRWLREGDSCTFSYERDELGRLIVPREKIEAAFAQLFGEKTIRTHHTVGDAEYNEESACYHVPIQSPTAVYVPVLDTINRDGRVYTVRVSYVLSQDIEYDYRGKEQEPTADMGKFAQFFVVQKNEDDTWTILSVEYEK